MFDDGRMALNRLSDSDSQSEEEDTIQNFPFPDFPEVGCDRRPTNLKELTSASDDRWMPSDVKRTPYPHNKCKWVNKVGHRRSVSCGLRKE